MQVLAANTEQNNQNVVTLDAVFREVIEGTYSGTFVEGNESDLS